MLWPMSDAPHADPLLTTQDVADRYGVSAKTVGRWVDGGVLPAVYTSGGHRRIAESDVLRFFASRRSLRARGHDAVTRVLLLSDDARTRQTVGSACRADGLGSGLQVAGAPFEAGLLVTRHWPKAIVLDLALPWVVPVETVVALRAGPPGDRALLIVVGDRIGPELRRALVDSGADHVVDRPLGAEFVRTVLGVLARR